MKKMFRSNDQEIKCSRCLKNIQAGFNYNQTPEYSEFINKLMEASLCPACYSWKQRIQENLEFIDDAVLSETADNIIGLGVV